MGTAIAMPRYYFIIDTMLSRHDVRAGISLEISKEDEWLRGGLSFHALLFHLWIGGCMEAKTGEEFAVQWSISPIDIGFGCYFYWGIRPEVSIGWYLQEGHEDDDIEWLTLQVLSVFISVAYVVPGGTQRNHRYKDVVAGKSGRIYTRITNHSIGAVLTIPEYHKWAKRARIRERDEARARITEEIFGPKESLPLREFAKRLSGLVEGERESFTLDEAQRYAPQMGFKVTPDGLVSRSHEE